MYISAMAASKPDSSQNLTAEDAEVTSNPQGQLEDCAGISNLEPAEMAVAFQLVRHSTMYSLTLDQIQNTVCEQGKSFGSMNMDEFLTNIWNVEEGFEASGPTVQAQCPAASPAKKSQLCRKTVDELWAEIHREQQRQDRKPQQQQQNLDRPKQNNGAATRERTFGEMTLEDFLIKAGVVREDYGLTGYTMMADGAQDFGRACGGGAAANGRGGDMYCYAGDAGGGLQLGMVGSPATPMSSDGMGGGCGGTDSHGMGMDWIAGKSGCGGRKRIVEGVVEKVVERRQRRMIKNRESAARSRARKQAYTVELETELKYLKEENAQLKVEERKVQQIGKQMLLEAMDKQTHHNMDKTGSLRRCNSSPS